MTFSPAFTLATTNTSVYLITTPSAGSTTTLQLASGTFNTVAADAYKGDTLTFGGPTVLSGIADTGTNATTLQLAAGTFNTMTANFYVGYTVVITSGTGVSQSATVTASTTAGVLTFAALTTPPVAGSGYTVSIAPILAGVVPTSASNTATSMQLAAGTFNAVTPNFYAGYTLNLTGGTGAGETAVVLTSTVLGVITFATQTTPPALNTTYTLTGGPAGQSVVVTASTTAGLLTFSPALAVAPIAALTPYTLIAGQGGQSAVVTASSAAGVLSFAALPFAPVAGLTSYARYRGA